MIALVVALNILPNIHNCFLIILNIVGVLAFHEASEQESCQGLLWEDQAPYGPRDYDHQGQV